MDKKKMDPAEYSDTKGVMYYEGAGCSNTSARESRNTGTNVLKVTKTGKSKSNGEGAV